MIYHLELFEKREGFRSTASFDPELPECQGNDDPSITYIPSCYATLQEEDYLHYPSKYTSDDYILKTKIVTPVCPNNPYDSVGSILDTDASFNSTWNMNENTRLNRASDALRESANALANTVSNTVSNTLPNSGLNTDANVQSDNNPVPSNQPGLSNNASIQVPSTPASPSDQFLLTPQKPSTPSPASKEDVSSSPGQCPPCPACERCPEPVVECKKVVKYKDQQYPLPLIADFSAFSKF